MNSLERSSDQENSLQFRSNPSGLITLPDILKALTSLEEEETQLSDALSSLLFDDEPVQSALGELESLASHLDEINNDAVILSKNVHTTAQTAERVGGRVRILDEEMKRVKEAAERVGQVIELKVRTLVAYTGAVNFNLCIVFLCRCTVLNGGAGLGNSNETVCPYHGPAFRSYCGCFR